MTRFLKERGKYLRSRAKYIALIGLIWSFIYLVGIAVLYFTVQVNKTFPLVAWTALALMVLIIIGYLKFANYSLKKSDDYYNGDTGEIDVEKILKEQLSDDFFVIPDIKISLLGNIDFVVVSPTGIFALEVKYTKKHYNRFWKRDPAKQAKRNATWLGNKLRKDLRDESLFVEPVVVFNNEQYIKKKNAVRIISKDQLVEFLNEDHDKWMSLNTIEGVANKILSYGQSNNH